MVIILKLKTMVELENKLYGFTLQAVGLFKELDKRKLNEDFHEDLRCKAEKASALFISAQKTEETDEFAKLLRDAEEKILLFNREFMNVRCPKDLEQVKHTINQEAIKIEEMFGEITSKLKY